MNIKQQLPQFEDRRTLLIVIGKNVQRSFHQRLYQPARHATHDGEVNCGPNWPSTSSGSGARVVFPHAGHTTKGH